MRGVKGLNDASNSLAYPSVFVSPASRLNYTREKEKRERERERERSMDRSRVDPACWREHARISA